jgi:hypothetical protein
MMARTRIGGRHEARIGRLKPSWRHGAWAAAAGLVVLSRGILVAAPGAAAQPIASVPPAASAEEAHAKAATLGVEQIIHGIEQNQAAWRGLKGWMVRYLHAREQIDPPPGMLVLYGDNRIVNARKGSWLFASEDQTSVANPAHITGRQTWVLWKDGQYTQRDHETVTSRSGPPDLAANLALNVFYYPNSLFRDFLSDTFPLPAEFWQADEPSLTLPRCLSAHVKEYHVRKEREAVDSFPCHVLEWPGHDIIWIDDACGFSVRRRKFFLPSGSMAFEMKASGFEQKAPGIWIPARQTGITYNPDTCPPQYRGKIMRIATNSLIEARFGDVPDSLFQIPRPPGAK